MKHPVRLAAAVTIAGLALWAAARWRAPHDPGGAIPWYPTYPLALEASRAEDRPLLVYFQASWCAVCRRLEGESLSDPDVIRALAGWTPVKLDVEREKGLAERFQVAGVPALLLLDKDQAVTARLWGFVDAPRLAAALER